MHKDVTNLEIADLLRNVSAVYRLEDENKNRFRIDAYDRAAAAVEHLSSEAKDLWDEGKLNIIPGVGPGISGHLSDIFAKGKSLYFESLLAKYPGAMFEFMKIPGIGPKTAYKLAKDLKITSPKDAVAKLKKALEEGRVAKIEGLGEKSALAFQKGIKEAQGREGRMLLPYAQEIADEIIAWMRQEKTVWKIEVLGSLRRKASTIGDIDIAAATKNSQKAITRFVKYKNSKRTLDKGEKSASILLPGDIRVDLKTVDPTSWGSMLQHFTGSKQHNIVLREFAVKKGLSLSEYGIREVGKPKHARPAARREIRKFTTEEEFYKFLGLKYIPPELREGVGEIETAQNNKIPDLVKQADIKGDLHMHSDFNIETSHDLGIDAMWEHLKKAEELGYEYIAFTEHNPSRSKHTKTQITEILKRKREAVDKLTGKVRAFNSLEIDILPDGSLPVPEEGLQTLDFALVSIHSSFDQTRKTTTERVLRALSHPKVKIFAHPTARLLQKREGVELDWEKIFEFCAKNNKWLEINADPSRLDLPDFLARDAVGKKVKFTLGTDSHNIQGMDNMKYGVSVARRGWCTKNDIINTLSLKDFEGEVKKR